MYINEIEFGSSVRINVKIGKKVLKFNTDVVDTGITNAGRYVACSFVIIDKKILNFSGHQVYIDVHNNADGRDYRFFLEAFAIHKEYYNMRLYCNASVKAKNHRDAYRVPCSYKVVLRIGDNRKPIDGYVHDLSITGVSYIFASDLVDIHVGDTVSGSIYDTSTHIQKTFGEIVRICKNFSDDLTLIGVKFKGSSDLTGLVNKLQQNELRIRGEKHY